MHKRKSGVVLRRGFHLAIASLSVEIKVLSGSYTSCFGNGPSLPLIPLMPNQADDHAGGIVRELRQLSSETEWAEFKENLADPEQIGEYISALSNGAAVCRKRKGYLVWGIEDETHEIVGTSFSPSAATKGSEQLENWLLRLLQPKIDFQFHELTVEGLPVVLLEIERAFRHPVKFKGQEFIRVNSYTQKLKQHPQKERALWRVFDETPFEARLAEERIDDARVLQQIDYPAYFDLLQIPLPEERSGILEALRSDELIERNDAGSWDVTNLGAILFARDLSSFRGLRRKALRVVEYDGVTRIRTKREFQSKKGYASGFESVIESINSRLPSNEIIGEALREDVPMYPELAIRELVANALIHQDFFVTGAGPMVEIFDDRVEITNPGKPLVDTARFLDTPPKSRNETLASLMRRMRICEERGSGIDKVVHKIEFYQLPAPIFEVPEDNTRAILLAPRTLSEMDKDDRVRACYLHACLKHVQRDYLTNSSLRKRFGIKKRNSAKASRLIREAVDDGAIRPHDPDAAPKYMKYVPFWA